MDKSGGNAQRNEQMRAVGLPLENIAFMIEQYLLENGNWLDPKTRMLLAGVRDGVRHVAARSCREPSAKPALGPDLVSA